MERALICECGFVVTEFDEDALVAKAQAHATDMHRIRFTRDQVLALARPVTPGSARPVARS